MDRSGSSTAETTPLLSQQSTRNHRDLDVEESLAANFKNEPDFVGDGLRERLPYNDYTTIDWLRDLVKDSERKRQLSHLPGIRGKATRLWDHSQGWIAAALIGLFTAVVAFVVDVNVAVISDWKVGYCSSNVFLDRDSCCKRMPGRTEPGVFAVCDAWRPWATEYSTSYCIYVVVAVLYAFIAGGVTMTTKANLPATSEDEQNISRDATVVGKMMYMAAGSGIPEIKTILSGFVIPHFLDFKVLVVKAVGATFAVATGMCLGKEGPFVHISTCAGYLVSNLFPKYRDNPRKLREMLSVACSSGLSVAFGAPIGGVLFSYEVGNALAVVLQKYVIANARASDIGDQHVLPEKGPMESIPVLARCCGSPETAEPDGYWKVGSL
jgi:chloride channel 3/4/5